MYEIHIAVLFLLLLVGTKAIIGPRMGLVNTMLHRRRDSKHARDADADADKIQVLYNTKEKVKAFFRLDRPFTTRIRDVGSSPGAAAPFPGSRSGNATGERKIFSSPTS